MRSPCTATKSSPHLLQLESPHIAMKTSCNQKINKQTNNFLKTLRSKHRQNILWHKLYQCFLRSVSQSNRNKSQKGKENKETKRQHSEWEKYICEWNNLQGLNLQNIQTAHIVQNQKNKQHDQKWACTLGHFSRVWLFVTLWTVTCQAPLSMGFARQED